MNIELNPQEKEEKEIYDFLLKECSMLSQQIEELLKENVDAPKKSKIQPNVVTEPNFEEKPENYDLRTDPNEKIDINGENEELEEKEDQDDYKKKKEALLNQKKYLEDQFLDINIDIQKKANQLRDFEETIKRTKMEIGTCDKQIKEKTEFIQFLEEQINALAGRSYKK